MVKTKAKATWIDCPGIQGGNRFEHSMRDHCWNCAPFWERLAVCPQDGARLTTRGYCKACRKHYDMTKES